MTKEELLNELKKTPEMDPDEHDGSYELMQTIVHLYDDADISQCDYKDLNAIYAMALGTWKLNVEKKKEYVRASHLPDNDKERMCTVIDKVWDNACRGKYHNKIQGRPSVGMFGTGFLSFQGRTTEESVQSFIKLLCFALRDNEEERVFNEIKSVFSGDFRGMRAASASAILHCLKPFVFPVLNGNMGNGNIFEKLGVKLDKPEKLETYIDNCRRIQSFRDAQLPFKNYRILDLMAGKIDEQEDGMDTDMNEVSLNTILYGPPGTGKTYNTVIYAVAIIEKKALATVKVEAAEDYAAVKKRFDEYKEAGRIAFTTFHQSYGYEEFIEGIKPCLSEEDNESGLEYSIEPGVFKRFCDRAGSVTNEEAEDYGFNKEPVVWKVSLSKTYDNPVREECLKNNHIRIGWDSYGPEITDDINFAQGGKIVLNYFINKMKIGDIVLSCYSSEIIDAIGVVTGDYEWDDSFDQYKRVRKVRWIAKGIRQNIVNYNTGAPMTLATVYKLRVSVADVIKMLGAEENNANVPQAENKDNYVFIIDEINRGNISKIFGELITLIEDTKRIGADEEMRVMLPYSSGKPFGVPKNVYIFGTMNTADRSIALMDTALRRRFTFEEMMPDAQVLRDIGADKVQKDGKELDVAAMLDVINKRIEYLYDREHTIGHAFFTGLKDDPSIEKLASIFKKSVIPLLQEYFYEDYSKIQLVLGDDGKKDENKQYQFIRDEEVKPSEIFRTTPEQEIQRKTYIIQESAFDEIESYKMIGKDL